ncbi:pyruvate kinase alpha/beta domain-containing protein, partial [Streptococcus suis]
YRPDEDIFALTFSEKVQKSLMLNWGVIPFVTNRPDSTDDMFDLAELIAKEQGIVEAGDDMIIVAGVPVGVAGSTNTM